MIPVGDADRMTALGETLGAILRPGDIVALTGGLGAGKTTFTRGILRGLGHQGEVPSPSFAIIQLYEVPSVAFPVAHVDLYRIEKDDELAELGLDEWLTDGAIVVEWPDRLGPGLLAGALAIDIGVDANGARILTVRLPEAWGRQWP